MRPSGKENSEVAEEVIVECWDAVVSRESVDGPWTDKFILVDDPLHMLRFVRGLSGPCIEEDGEGKTTGLRRESAS